ncbi:2'-5' RNA ligase family protein [Segetibacter koreensis]|uniref:2'-5' RNA ligase family protein n=1 Tax=Segetibacter koreensis TaxID=398037 RepID=UPI0012F9F548|nr:2'-5' RNA ligase family protein [Segetibacter koreensis]
MEAGLVYRPSPGAWSHPEFYEYLLVAHPNEDVCNRVMAEKQSFYSRFNEKIAIKTRLHITVSSFLAKEAMEETIIRYLQRICNQQSAFDVMLNNYSGFPPHTIYIRVQNPQMFKQLTRELKAVNSYVHSCSCPPVKLVTSPHVSIARSLSEEVYFKAMMEYSQRTFHETFTVDELVLLRRSNQYDSCKPINVFRLAQPVNNLFN